MLPIANYNWILACYRPHLTLNQNCPLHVKPCLIPQNVGDACVVQDHQVGRESVSGLLVLRNWTSQGRYGQVYFVCLSSSVCGVTTGTFSWSQPYIDYMLAKNHQNIAKHDNILANYYQNDQIHIEFFQGPFSRNQKIQCENNTGFRGVGLPVLPSSHIA